MAESQLDCPSSVDLTAAEIAWLDALPNGNNGAPETVWCELEARHPGRHVALAEDTGGPDDQGIMYWVWWAGDDAHEVTAADPCDATEPRDDDPPYSLCQLPEGHAGRHLFF